MSAPPPPLVPKKRSKKVREDAGEELSANTLLNIAGMRGVGGVPTSIALSDDQKIALIDKFIERCRLNFKSSRL